MNYAAIRAQLTVDLTAACAPVRVVEEEPGVVAGLAVVVCWVGCEQTAEGWAHRFEERVILTGHDDPVPHFAERDKVLAVLLQRVRRWSDQARSWKAAQVSCVPATVQIGGAPHPAVICRHIVTEPLKLD